MRFAWIVAAGLAGALPAGTAAAAQPCAEAIAALDARLDEAAEAAISASSGGQGVAGAREGQALDAERRGVPVGEPAVPYQRDAKETQAVKEAAKADAGGDAVMQARAALNRARSLDRNGDAGCRAAVAEAEALLAKR
ncbi:MAG TPA: hypothetical protein VEB20_00295 [Azospirillaceae bacterium]|nr:hypothetical protein [Azospirillaceae bacterium]